MTMNRKLKPCGDRLLVKLKQVKEKTDWGFQLSSKDVAKAERFATQEAYVVELGYDAYKGLGSGEMWCKVGDLVLINKYSGEDREDIEDEYIYRIISDQDVIAIFEGEGLND